MPSNPKFTGLIAATFTPFARDGSLDLRRIDAYAERLIDDGVCAAFVCGTTGESSSLTIEERMVIASQWQRVAGEQLPIIVHVGHNCLADAKTLAAHAQRIGAAGVAALSPTFFKPTTIADLANWCAAITAAAPGLPFYYYHIPSMTGVALPCAEFLRVAGPLIPTLAGVKFTYEDLMDLQQSMSINQDRFQVLFGRDEILLAGLSLGCTAAVGSTYNFFAPVYQDVIRCFAKGDLVAARQHQQRATQMIDIMVRHGGLAAGKALQNLRGPDCGRTRSPIACLSDAGIEALANELALAGLLDLIKRK